MDGLLKNSFRFENFVCIQGQIRKQYFIMHIQYLICTSVFGLNWKLFCGTKEGLLQFLEHLGLGLLICTVNGELLMLKDEKRCFTFFSAELEQYHLILHGTYYVHCIYVPFFNPTIMCSRKYIHAIFSGCDKSFYFIKLTG